MQIFMNIRLVSGHPSIYANADVNLTVHNGGLEIEYRESLWKTSTVIIHYSDITSLQTDEQKERSLGKAATGAIIGGVLTGGIGLIAGAAIGGRLKDNSNLYVGYILNGAAFVLTFKSGKKTPMIYNEIINNFSKNQEY